MSSITDRMIEQAHQEWMAALDKVESPIFMHDNAFRILRCNRAYQQYAGLPFKKIIGRPYYEIFPKSDIPLQHCRQTLDTASSDGEEEEVQIGSLLFRSRAYAIKNERDEFLYSVHILDDITKIRFDEKALKASELKFQAIFDKAHDGILLTDIANRKFTAGNARICEMLGYTLDELTALSITDIYPKKDLPSVLKQLQKLERGEIELATDLPLKRKDGTLFFADVSTFTIVIAEKEYLAGFFRDTTVRKQTQQRLKLFRTLLDNSSDAIEVLEPLTLHFLDVNEAECRALGFSREELLSMHIYDIDPALDEKMTKTIQEQIAKEGSARFEGVHRRKDGSTFPVEVSSKLVKLDKPYLLNIVRDITDRRQADTALKNEALRRRILMESSRDGIAIINQQHQIIEANARFAEMLGYTPEEVLGLYTWDYEATMTEAEIRESFSNLLDTNMTIETRHRRKNGSTFPVEVSIGGTKVGSEALVFTISRDITERKQAETALSRANRALRTLSAGNLALVRAQSEDELLKMVTEILVEHGGYCMAAVYYAENDEPKSIVSKAWSGIEDSYYSGLHISWGDNEQGQLPVSRAIRRVATQISHDILNDPVFLPLRDAALARGYVSNIALPLSAGGKTFGALSIYASEANAFDDEEVHLLEELASDLAYGISTLRTRVAHEQHTLLLRQSLEQSIQTIAATVESRDPYTAGHQRRVAELATAIAREMELPEEQVQGVHFAAIIHDLGKIHVPAEILSKPGKLSELEFMLIQTHPQTGYDILKDITFPWPIADIILQHHERLDGSGYPQGLKGHQILFESNILAVADVVEAMSSHRPYRAALGVEYAMAEIRRGRGSVYDPAIVDACLKLFTEKEFQFTREAL